MIWESLPNRLLCVKAGKTLLGSVQGDVIPSKVGLLTHLPVFFLC